VFTSFISRGVAGPRRRHVAARP